MPKAALLIGIALVILGIGSYLGTGRASVTALIPAFFGLPFVIIGGIALRGGERVRMHAMHVAAVLALLGCAGPAAQALPKLGQLLAGEAERPAAVMAQLIMGVLCGVFLVFCIRSFIAARRARA